MSIIGHGWSGKDWQEHICTVLHEHFFGLGLRFQDVPDQVGGDNGMEGFSTDGHGFQAFADENSNNKKERAEKQCRKISDDLPKLYTYRKEWAARLRSLKLRTWTLVVPAFEAKAVLDHAVKEGEKIRAQKLSFVAGDFRALVCDTRPFKGAIARVGNRPTIKLPTRDIEAKHVEKYELRNPKLVKTMDQKLERIPTVRDTSRVIDVRRQYLRSYLYRENMLQSLLGQHPALRERIDELLSAKGAQLANESELDDKPANHRVLQVQSDLKSELSTVARSLNQKDREDIARGSVGWWLLNCNLNFLENDDANGRA